MTTQPPKAPTPPPAPKAKPPEPTKAERAILMQARYDKHQNRESDTWLEGAKGQRVRVRWTDGQESEGTLLGWDRYTYTLEIMPGRPALVHKHAVASLTVG